jgi:SAM-dependent methyltransferase
MKPLAPGTDQQFAAARDYLQEAGYTLEAVCQRVKLALPYDFTRLRPSRSDAIPADALEVLIRVLLLGESVSRATVAAMAPAAVLDALMLLGLLEPEPGSADRLFSPIALCPVEGLFFVSDRWSAPAPDGSHFSLPPDAVYPALTFNTQIFLKHISYLPCARVLDLCSGTGVAAMLSSRFAERAWAVDVTERCTQFAEFNRRLNGLPNVTVLQGDLFAAVPGETFDRILAHPPYVPVLKPRFVYADGGDDGEQITRRIISGLPEHLQAGGSFQCHTMLTDRETPVEQRLREWLGPSHSEFDVLVVVRRQLEPINFAAEVALKNGDAGEFETWKQRFAEWKVSRMLDVCITLQRHPAPGQVALTLRRTGTDESTSAEAEWLLAWERLSARPEIYGAMLRARPIMSPRMQLAVIHRPANRVLRPEACNALVKYPYTAESEVDGWMPALLAECTGEATGLELFEKMQQCGNIPPETPPEKFGAFLAASVSRGLIYVEDFPLPKLKSF